MNTASLIIQYGDACSMKDISLFLYNYTYITYSVTSSN